MASGWLAAILVLTVGDPQLEGTIGPTPQPPATPIAGIVDFYGPTDFLQADRAHAAPPEPAALTPIETTAPPPPST